ncbi:MAG TPA: hypothetical protein PKN62_01015 [bacterium]|nr:hypothetical protein [bacterium]
MRKKGFFQKIYLEWKLNQLGIHSCREQLLDMVPDGSLFLFKWRQKCRDIFGRYGHIIKIVDSQRFPQSLMKIIPKELVLSTIPDWEWQVDKFILDNGQLLKNPESSAVWWRKWYELMGFGQVEISDDIFTNSIPGYWNIAIGKDLTIESVVRSLKKVLEFGQFWPGSLSRTGNITLPKEIIENIRTSKESYLISFEPIFELNIDWPMLKSRECTYPTLLEVLVLYLFIWSTIGKLLDKKSVTRCGGTKLKGDEEPLMLTYDGVVLLDSTIRTVLPLDDFWEHRYVIERRVYV